MHRTRRTSTRLTNTLRGSLSTVPHFPRRDYHTTPPSSSTRQWGGGGGGWPACAGGEEERGGGGGGGGGGRGPAAGREREGKKQGESDAVCVPVLEKPLYEDFNNMISKICGSLFPLSIEMAPTAGWRTESAQRSRYGVVLVL